MNKLICFFSFLLLVSCSNKKQVDALFESKEIKQPEDSKRKTLKDFQLHLNELQSLDSLEYEDSIIPKNIGSLINLKFLFLITPLVKEFPKEIGNLKNLKTLWIDYNFKATELPKEIENLNQLEDFRITKSKQKQFPIELCQLPKLKSISITWSDAITSLPQQIGNLENLEVLDLSGNNISFIPSTIFNCKRLNKLGLLNNHMTQDSLIRALRDRKVEVYLDSYINR
jgi:Leucine-rich repeat (LRR) protein